MTTRSLKKRDESRASRTGLLKAPVRDWQTHSTYKEIFVIPTRKRHDSGWMLMAIVGKKDDGSYERAAWCDDICWHTETTHKEYAMRTDCTYPGGILHFWNATFTVGSSLSSTDVTVKERVLQKVAA